MVDISLLPEEKSDVKRKALASLFTHNVSLIAGGILFVLLLGISAALFGYRVYLNKQVAALDEEISTLNASLDANMFEQMTAFDSQIKTVKKILDVHVEGSRLFSFLEENTFRQVVWSNLNADFAKAEVNVSGRASTYSVLAKQVSHFSSLPRVKDVSVSGITLSPEGGVQFSLRIGVNPEEFMRR